MAAKIGDEVWNALKRQCAATKENSPEWDKVSKLVMVGKDDIAAALEAVAPLLIREGMPPTGRNFSLGDRVTKISGSSWTGRVVGFYSTYLTPNGYCIESENEPGSVQIYPEGALVLKEGDT